jgi:hypothetical protein
LRRFNRRALTYLIQNNENHKYFCYGNWTADLRLAEEFAALDGAIRACLTHELHQVELVLQFGLEGGRTCRLQLPLPEAVLWPQGAANGTNSFSKRSSASSLVNPKRARNTETPTTGG